MITQTAATWHTPPWKQSLREAVRDVDQLLALVGLADSPLAARVCRDQPFPLRVPLPFVQRMDRGNPDDPLLRQVLPLKDENDTRVGYVTDPLQESRYNPVPGIIHKYCGRVLLITSPACAIHCRYCFRRHFPYDDNNPGKLQWQQSLDYLRCNDTITEVILSGGDPLASDDRHLAWLVAQLGSIPHLKRLRIHSRLPVTIPARIDPDCLTWLTGTRLRTSLVIHVNHGNEIDTEVGDMIARVRSAGITVLNQTVLMRGINDTPQALVSLQEKLFDHGALPYYLHLLDPVAGAAHFDVPIDDALVLHRHLQHSLPGYLVPKLVQDIPGRDGKTVIA